MATDKLAQRAETFQKTWLSNPAAVADFYRLLLDATDADIRDHYTSFQAFCREEIAAMRRLSR